MISPKAIELMIKHWDAVDASVSKRVSRKRPWTETALTSLLCDLLDSETQGDIQLKYTLADLNRDLAKLDGILTFTIEIETMEYPPKIERWVNQSDLGFYIQYRDEFIPKNSWEYAFLCQAKRLYPSNQAVAAFDESSRFQGFNYEQHNRIKRLHDALGEKIVHYLLYCPRPIDLDDLIIRLDYFCVKSCLALTRLLLPGCLYQTRTICLKTLVKYIAICFKEQCHFLGFWEFCFKGCEKLLCAEC